MARLNQEALIAVTRTNLDATDDPSGAADLVCDKGAVIVAAEQSDLKSAFKRAKKLPGYKWVVIHRADLFAANPLSLGSKAGIIDENGNMLKNADVPRKKI